jgi:hypothetical protein
MDGLLDVLELGLPCHAQFVMHLEFQPEFRRGPEVSREPQGRAWARPGMPGPYNAPARRPHAANSGLSLASWLGKSLLG